MPAPPKAAGRVSLSATSDYVIIIRNGSIDVVPHQAGITYELFLGFPEQGDVPQAVINVARQNACSHCRAWMSQVPSSGFHEKNPLDS